MAWTQCSTVSPTLKRTLEVKIVLPVYILSPLNGEKSLPDDRVIDLSVLQRTNMYTIIYNNNNKVNDTIFYRSKATCTCPGRWQRLIKRNESYIFAVFKQSQQAFLLCLLRLPLSFV